LPGLELVYTWNAWGKLCKLRMQWRTVSSPYYRSRSFNQTDKHMTRKSK
jgi:hypothetical protein